MSLDDFLTLKSKKYDNFGCLLSKSSCDIILFRNQTFFGRRPENHIVFPHARISGKHCRIWREDEKNFVEDLSANGTYINQKKIGKGNTQELLDGDEITFLKPSEKKDTNDLVFTFHTSIPPFETIYRTEEISHHYVIGETIGMGTFSEVRMAIHVDSKTPYTVKIIDKRKWRHPRNEDQIHRELRILQRVKHPNIVKLIDKYESRNFVFLIFEYAKGGELFHHIWKKKFSLEEIRLIFKQILEAVTYLHSLGIVHRDLKPENILFRDDDLREVVLIDFGFARFVGENGEMTTLCGTPSYLAPELLNRNKIRRGYGKSVDMWSLGTILYALLGGIPPFTENNHIPLEKQIELGIYSFPDEKFGDVPIVAKDLVSRLLNVNSLKRLTSEQALNHPWIIGTPIWIDDRSTDQCMLCSSPFTLMKRRHHCRNCGKIFCGECCHKKIRLPMWGFSKPVRCCEKCIIWQSPAPQP